MNHRARRHLNNFAAVKQVPGTEGSNNVIPHTLSKSRNHDIAYQETPAFSYTSYAGRDLSALHTHLSKANRSSFLKEFETKLGVSLRLETDGDKKVFNVYLPTDREAETIPSDVTEKIGLALHALQGSVAAQKSISRALVQFTLNQAVVGNLTESFKAAAAKKEAAGEKTEAILDTAMRNIVKLTDSEKNLIKRIKLAEIAPRTENQRDFLQKAENSEVTFCIAPAGTGKTFLAVNVALKLLLAGKVNRIVVTRPAVDAGERHGFLPGDIKDKMDPYLKPIYKSFMKLLADGDLRQGKALLKTLMEREIIEISPLAYMRGDEYENAATIGDEFQNATEQQLTMFLTRLGEGGHMIIVGDPEQTDLEPMSLSVLSHMATAFEKAAIQGISVARMDESDAVRHRLIPDMLRVIRQSRQERDSAPRTPAPAPGR